MAAEALGARSGRLFIVDYGLRCIRSLDANGTASEEPPLEGTIAGRAFATGEPTKQGDGPTVMWWPLSEGSERIGLLELTFDEHARASPSEVAMSCGSWSCWSSVAAATPTSCCAPDGRDRCRSSRSTVGSPPAAVLCRHEGRGERHPPAG